MKSKKLVVVIPAFNAEETIGGVISGINQTLASAEIVVVDDGSVDRTREIVESFGILCVRHASNSGKGAALQSGFRRALERGAALILTLDADNQHDPSEAIKLVEASEHLNGIVVGAREISPKSMPIHRWLSNYMTSRLIAIRTGTTIQDSQSGYRLYSAELLKRFQFSHVRFDFESEILIRACLAGYDIRFVNVRTRYFKNGKSAMRVLDIPRFIRMYLKSYSDNW